MTSRQKMKKFRNFIRQQLKDLNNEWRNGSDTHHIVDRVVVEIVKWNRKTNDVLVRVRDSQQDLNNYDTRYIQLDWIWLDSQFSHYKVWSMLNHVVGNMLYAEKLSN